MEENNEADKNFYPKTVKDLKNVCLHLGTLNCNHHLLKIMA